MHRKRTIKRRWVENRSTEQKEVQGVAFTWSEGALCTCQRFAGAIRWALCQQTVIDGGDQQQSRYAPILEAHPLKAREFARCYATMY